MEGESRDQVARLSCGTGCGSVAGATGSALAVTRFDVLVAGAVAAVVLVVTPYGGSARNLERQGDHPPSRVRLGALPGRSCDLVRLSTIQEARRARCRVRAAVAGRACGWGGLPVPRCSPTRVTRPSTARPSDAGHATPHIRGTSRRPVVVARGGRRALVDSWWSAWSVGSCRPLHCRRYDAREGRRRASINVHGLARSHSIASMAALISARAEGPWTASSANPANVAAYMPISCGWVMVR